MNLTTGTAIDITSTLTVQCSGLLTTVRICPNFGSGSGGMAASGSPRYALSGGNQLAYNFYQDAGRTIPWGSALDGAPTNPPTIDLPVVLLGASTSRTLYGRIFANQQTVPIGTYLSVFDSGHGLITFRNGTNLSCAQMGTINGQQAPIIVRAIYQSVCTVSATNMNFGNVAATALASGVNAQSTITAHCSAGTPYSIALNGGVSNAVDPTQRKMALGVNQVTYGLYRDSARSLPWGSTSGTNTFSGTGTGLAQAITVYGRVPAQGLPVPGTYTDTVVVTLTY